MEAEWFYNVETRRLHVRTRGDQHPCFLHVQARVQTYALRISNSTHLTLDHLHFFATTVWAGALSPGKDGDATVGDVQGIVFQGLSFEYPHAQQVRTRTDSSPTTLTLQTPFQPLWYLSDRSISSALTPTPALWTFLPSNGSVC